MRPVAPAIVRDSQRPIVTDVRDGAPFDSSEEFSSAIGANTDMTTGQVVDAVVVPPTPDEGEGPTLSIDEMALLFDKLRKGVPKTHAAALVGLTRYQLLGWITKGEDDPDGPFGSFSLACRFAIAEFVDETIDLWVKAVAEGNKAWTGYATLLERRDPTNFGRRESRKTEHEAVGVLGEQLKELQRRRGERVLPTGD